jgi:hypothetical protein
MEQPQKQRKVLRPTRQEGGNIKRELKRQVTTNSNLSPIVRKGWEMAAGVPESEVMAFIPTDLVLQVGEGFLAGHRSIDSLIKFTGAAREPIREVLMNPVAMAWLSRQIYCLFQNRTAIIDAQLYLRAAAGDLQAIKMFYERMDRLPTNKKEVNVNYSGGVDVRNVSDDELRNIIQEKKRLLPAEFKVINEKEDNEPVAEEKTDS